MGRRQFILTIASLLALFGNYGKLFVTVIGSVWMLPCWEHVQCALLRNVYFVGQHIYMLLK